MAQPGSFRIEIADAQVADLRERLARTRFPDEPPLEPWSTGTSLAYLRELVAYWRGGFSWKEAEARINRLRQYRMPIGGIELHYIHEPPRSLAAEVAAFFGRMRSEEESP